MDNSEVVAADPTTEPYQKPKLERLGTFRELTRCGGWLALLLGHDDDCYFNGSHSHVWHHSY